MGSKPRSKSGREQSRLATAERAIEVMPGDAVATLEQLAAEGVDTEVRVQALALLAIHSAGRGFDAALQDAEEMLGRARACGAQSRIARARLAHARGYLAYRRGERGVTLRSLNSAASLYPSEDRRRAQVFDTLGIHFWRDVGDLERARAYFLLSIELKRAAAKLHGLASERRGIAITYGNLGRLELFRERYEEAEEWFRKDLELIMAGTGRVVDEALVRNQLALALIGRGAAYFSEASRELSRAIEVAAPRSITLAFLVKDKARLDLERGHIKRAEKNLRRARQLGEAGGFSEVLLAVDLVAGRIASRRARQPADSATTTAQGLFDRVLSGYQELHMHHEACETAEAMADLLARVGRSDEATHVLLDVAVPIAERHLFNQLQPLARIDAKLEQVAPEALLRLRARRMLGGLTPEQHHSRLWCERSRLTVWSCDIRGFSSYCEETGDPMLVVDMLNRFFTAIGRPILDSGGRIDKYVGDSILAYFRDPTAAADAALRALQIVDDLNTERVHLRERVLEIGIGVATGEVVAGNVGFAGKLEHTIIGGTVNRACRLVSEAGPGSILLDLPSRDAIGDGYSCTPVPGAKLALKGLGRVAAFELQRRS